MLTAFLHNVWFVVGQGETDGLQRGGDERHVPVQEGCCVRMSNVKRVLDSKHIKKKSEFSSYMRNSEGIGSKVIYF